MNAKQILVAGSAFFFGAGVVSAASYQPFAPQGGLAITTLLPGVYADGSNGTVEQTARMADSSVQQADANKPNGYVQPDSTGAVTLPVIGSVASAPANASGDTVAAIADTAKSAQATAGSAVQANGGDASKTNVLPTGSTSSHVLSDIAAQAVGSVQQAVANKPSGYAQPDANGNVTLPVTGTTNLSPVTSSAPNSARARYLTDRFSDHYNLADLGAKLDNSTDDHATIQTIYNSLPDGSVVDIPRWSIWDGIINTPDPSKRITWNFANDFIGAYKPPPGDNDVSVGYRNGLHIVERDMNNSSYRGAPIYAEYWNANPNYPPVWDGNYQQYGPIELHAINGPLAQGNVSPFHAVLDGYSQHPAGNYDVVMPFSGNKYGQNSMFGFISNLNDFSGKPPGAFAQWNELDMSANGYDTPPWSAAFALPHGGARVGNFISANTMTDFNAWAPNVSYTVDGNGPLDLPKPKKVLVTGSDGIKYIWIAMTTGTTSATQPTFPVPARIIGSASNTTLTVTSVSNGTINVGDYLTGSLPVTPIQITAQVSGTPGGVGVYTLASSPGSDTPTGQPFYTAPHVTDNDITWQFGEENSTTVSAGYYVTGSTGSWDHAFAVSGTTVNGAGFTTENATMADNYKAAAVRVAAGQKIDLTGNSTMAGRNLHTLSYTPNVGLTYQANGATALSVNDIGQVFTLAGLQIGASQGASVVDIGGSATSKAFINMHSSASTNNNDVQFYASGGTAGESGQGHLEIDALGGFLLKGIVQMYGMTKANILATTSPVEGMTVYDMDDHAEVTYRCPTASTCGWFPVQYGAALSN